MTVLHNVRILDLDSSSSAGEPVDVEFADTITAIRPAADPDPSSAATLLPGLIDTHVHHGAGQHPDRGDGLPAEPGATGPSDAERFLTWQIEGGAELIKIIIEDEEATEAPALDGPTLTALVDGAHQRVS